MQHHILFSFLLFTTACFQKTEDTADLEQLEETDISDTDSPDDTAEDTGSSGQLNYERHFTRFGGCGDFFVYGQNDDDTIAIQISGSGLVQATFDAGETTTFDFDLTTNTDLTIVVLQGQNINHASCNDALDPDIELLIDKTYVAVNGTLSIEIAPTGNETSWGELPSDATILLQSSDFCANGSVEDCLNIGELSFSTAIGWLPG